MRLDERHRRNRQPTVDLLRCRVLATGMTLPCPTQDQEHIDRRAALISEYSAVVNNFRALAEIRFKLLNLLPLASLAAAALKPGPRAPGSLPFALFGLAATIAIAAYNKRNDQLYDQLVGRAAEIERELGTPDGAYANRLAPWLSFRLLPLWQKDSPDQTPSQGKDQEQPRRP